MRLLRGELFARLVSMGEAILRTREAHCAIVPCARARRFHRVLPDCVNKLATSVRAPRASQAQRGTTLLSNNTDGHDANNNKQAAEEPLSTTMRSAARAARAPTSGPRCEIGQRRRRSGPIAALAAHLTRRETMGPIDGVRSGSCNRGAAMAKW